MKVQLKWPMTIRLNLPAPYADVGMDLYWWPQTRDLQITYFGPAESLIAVGVATAELLARGKPGKTRRDADGDKARVDYRKGWVALHLRKRADLALRLPGITRMVLAEAQAETLRQMRAQGLRAEAVFAPAPPAQPTPTRPSYLRLVVNNTR